MYLEIEEAIELYKISDSNVLLSKLNEKLQKNMEAIKDINEEKVPKHFLKEDLQRFQNSDRKTNDKKIYEVNMSLYEKYERFSKKMSLFIKEIILIKYIKDKKKENIEIMISENYLMSLENTDQEFLLIMMFVEGLLENIEELKTKDLKLKLEKIKQIKAIKEDKNELLEKNIESFLDKTAYGTKINKDKEFYIENYVVLINVLNRLTKEDILSVIFNELYAFILQKQFDFSEPIALYLSKYINVNDFVENISKLTKINKEEFFKYLKGELLEEIYNYKNKNNLYTKNEILSFKLLENKEKIKYLLKTRQEKYKILFLFSYFKLLLEKDYFVELISFHKTLKDNDKFINELLFGFKESENDFIWFKIWRIENIKSIEKRLIFRNEKKDFNKILFDVVEFKKNELLRIVNGDLCLKDI